MKKLISILLICPLLLIGCSSHNGSLDSSNKKNSTSSSQYIYLFGGKIAANTSSNVSAKINAKISQIKVAEIYYHKLSEQITPFNNTALNLLNQIQQKLSQVGLSTTDKQIQAKSTLVKLVSRQAYSDAFDYTLMLCTLFVLIALIATLFIKNKNQLSSSNEEIKS